MPTYEYLCPACDTPVERRRKRKNKDKRVECPCGVAMQRQISIPNTPKKGVKGPQPITSPVENTGSTGIRIAPGVRGTRSVGNTFRGLGTGIEVGANATLDSDGDKFHGNRDAIRSEDADVTVRDVTID